MPSAVLRLPPPTHGRSSHQAAHVVGWSGAEAGRPVRWTPVVLPPVGCASDARCSSRFRGNPIKHGLRHSGQSRSVPLGRLDAVVRSEALVQLVDREYDEEVQRAGEALQGPRHRGGTPAPHRDFPATTDPSLLGGTAARRLGEATVRLLLIRCDQRRFVGVGKRCQQRRETGRPSPSGRRQRAVICMACTERAKFEVPIAVEQSASLSHAAVGGTPLESVRRRRRPAARPAAPRARPMATSP